MRRPILFAVSIFVNCFLACLNDFSSRAILVSVCSALVPVPRIKDCKSGCDFEAWFVAVFTFGHDLGKGMGCPVERVSDLIPFCDELVEPGLQVIEIVEVYNPQSLATQDGEPLFDLIHPGTVHRWERKLESRVLHQPFLRQLSVVSR